MPSRAWLLASSLLFMVSLSGPGRAATFNGTVYEDTNFGGGVGRAFGTAGTVGVSGARVEFYTSGGTYISSTTTSGTGTFTLDTGNLSNAAVTIRVVNGTVRSTRTNGSTCTTCVPVQTFRTVGSGNTIAVVTNRVGGENPALSDSIANTTNATFGSLTVPGMRPQSFTTVTPQFTTSVINNINFGFNFDLVVNTRDATVCTAAASSYPCQGSLRQFIINSNALGGEASLAQSGNGLIDGLSSALPSGYESSVFMIPDGSNANAGQTNAYATQLSGAGVAVITLAGAMTAVSTANTRLDATTQTVNIGDDNGGTLGTGGTVGVNAMSLPTFAEPEVQLDANNTVVTLSGNNGAILGFALRQGFILLSGTGCLAQHNLVGMTATGNSGDASTAAYGITFTGSNSTVRRNFVTVNNSGIRTDNGGANSLVTLNEVARPTSGHTNTFDGILLVGTVSGIEIRANLARDQQGGGIEVGHGGGASASNILVVNNTVQGNGFTNVGGPTPSTEPVGMDAFAFAGSNVVFSRNVVRNNAGPGIVVISVTGAQFTQNSFSSNGGLSIDLDPRGIDPNGLGTPQGVTINDLNDSDAGPNNQLNYPVITSAALVNGEFSFGGFARPGSSIELYIAQVDPSGFGEGLTYLNTFVEGSAADVDTSAGPYGPANINGIAQGEDSTNRFAFRVTPPGGVAVGTTLSSTATISGQTSEFGGNVVVTAGPTLLVAKAVSTYSDPANGTTNPKSIPGAAKLYTLTVTNQGPGPVDNNSVLIVDKIPTNTKMYLGDLGAVGSGPVQFVNGTPSSALTWTYIALNNTLDDLEFSSDGGVTWVYAPTLDAQFCDAAITDVRMRPKGTMPPQGAGSPNFQLRFRVVVK